MNIRQEIEEAEQRIRPYVLRTPLLESPALSELVEGRVFLKMESEQLTGSFKVRGAFSKLLSVPADQRQRGAVAASTGNHGLGFAHALQKLGVQGTVFLPHNASPSKREALGRYPVELRYHGNDCVDTERFAKAYAIEQGQTWVSPYNDPAIIGGQGTVGLEIDQQHPEPLDAVLVTVGGGGLISGIGGWLKSRRPNTQVVACQPKASRAMMCSLSAGHVVADPDERPTLSDASAGGIEEDAVTFPVCQSVIDDCLTASEGEIAESIRLFLRFHHKVIEGAAAVAVACLLQEKTRWRGRSVAVVICGGNLDPDRLKSLL